MLQLQILCPLVLNQVSTAGPDPDVCWPQRCRLFTCDPSVRHKEMEPSLAAAKTFAKLRVGSGLRRASHSSSDNGSPAALAAPAAVHGAKQEEPAEVKPVTGSCFKPYGATADGLQQITWPHVAIFRRTETLAVMFRSADIRHQHMHALSELWHAADTLDARPARPCS